MLILTPEQIAAFRAAYMLSLAVALTEGNVLQWQSATDEERAEVRNMLTGWHKLPDEIEQARRYQQIQDAKALRALKKKHRAITRDAKPKTSVKSPEKPPA